MRNVFGKIPRKAAEWWKVRANQGLSLTAPQWLAWDSGCEGTICRTDSGGFPQVPFPTIVVPSWANMERFCLCCLSEQWLKVYCKDLNGSEMRPVDDLGLVVCSCWQMKKCDLDDISNQSRLKSVRSVCVSVTNIRVLVKLIMASVLICVSCNGSFPKQDCLIAFNHLWSY